MAQPITLTDIEAEAILTLCLLAAFADGEKNDEERAAVKNIAASLAQDNSRLGSLIQRVLLGQVRPGQAVEKLDRGAVRQLGYEMAVCVCDADATPSPREREFLQQLRHLLQLEPALAEQVEADAGALASSEPATNSFGAAPGDSASTDAAGTREDDEIGTMITNYAILNGALELMPQSLSTLAIIPLQMKMVYRIGKRCGYELDRGHIKELLAAAGVGLTSQVLEGYATKLLGGFFGKLGGKIGRAAASQAASSAMSFAATYAIGQLALHYYAGGRTLSSAEMRRRFDTLKADAAALHSRYAGAIEQRSQTLDAAQIAEWVRS